MADAFIAPAATAPLGRPTLLACLKQLARARAEAAEGQPPALTGMHGIPVGGAELARHGYVDLGLPGAADGGASAPPGGLPVVSGVPTLMPLGGAGPACYLLFTEDRGGALLLQWSETPVDGALAAFEPAKPPPRFKLTANGGQSELKRGVGESSSTNLKAFYAAWASFIRAAFASGGRFFFMSNLPTNPVGVYLCQADSSVRKVQSGPCPRMHHRHMHMQRPSGAHARGTHTARTRHAHGARTPRARHAHAMRTRRAHAMLRTVCIAGAARLVHVARRCIGCCGAPRALHELGARAPAAAAPLCRGRREGRQHRLARWRRRRRESFAHLCPSTFPFESAHARPRARARARARTSAHTSTRTSAHARRCA